MKRGFGLPVNPENQTMSQRHFDDYWVSYIGTAVSKRRAQQPELYLQQKKEVQVASIAKLFALKRFFQLAIFNSLRTELPTGAQALDLMSGVGTSTVPLISCGKLDELVMIDNSHSETCPAIAFEIIDKKKLATRVKIVNISIDSETKPAEIPNIPYVVLSDTGLSLEECYRSDESAIGPDPRTQITNHVLYSTADFGDVLKALQSEGRRTLYVFDTPFMGTSVPLNQARDYVQGFVDRLPGWEIEQWTEMPDCKPMMKGKLNYSA